MIELQRRLELEWQAATARNDKERIRRTTENGSFHVFTFCGSLRGFKTPDDRAIGFMEPVFCRESLLRDRPIALWNFAVKTLIPTRVNTSFPAMCHMLYFEII
jgi:hypothetical protein